MLRIIQVTAVHLAAAVSQWRFPGQTELWAQHSYLLPAQYQQFYLVWVLGTGTNACASEQLGLRPFQFWGRGGSRKRVADSRARSPICWLSPTPQTQYCLPKPETGSVAPTQGACLWQRGLAFETCLCLEMGTFPKGSEMPGPRPALSEVVHATSCQPGLSLKPLIRKLGCGPASCSGAGPGLSVWGTAQ